MNKEDWVDYFEVINGREPSAKEIAEALAAGEFQNAVETDPSSKEKSELVQDSAEKMTAETAEAEPDRSSQLDQELAANQANAQTGRHQQVEQLKKKGESYFVWFWEGLKRPEVQSSKSQFTYGLVTLAIAALFLAAGLVNYINRIFTSIINMTIGGESFKINEPEAFSVVEDAVRTNFGFSKIIVVTVIVFIAYAIIAVLPALIHKFATKSQEKVTFLWGKSIAYTPLLAAINLLVFLLSFLTSNKLVVSSKYSYQIVSSFSSVGSDPFEGLSSVSHLIKEVPAIRSIQTVFIYLILLSVVSLAVLIVAVLTNIKVSLGSLNNFYVRLIALLIFVLIIFFATKSIATNLLGGLDGIKDSLTKLY
ncbi:hypothetical protein ACVRW7_07495 [Streptococcus ratti]|uniref:Uncharacterized protein n=1 Tax=Streptococcus ratti FA-1 = DSM 20564 TaxID=699248 RepID=A0ABP2R1M2_STRRT|nr:hypothetical protein [Streptococcus ratti]EJN95183.1 hypothetical protein SRA_00728 [Streptococcus ratti FA-1 = DSM 20564]EMP69881.1 hypothetical protein D822_06208 [Streptococcus ratti FA-1 = DSM 20564]QEY07173.1 hypothetical protein FY406_05715 [Streptococcus ratti]VEI59602.1 Uncharacterised protein [Streptococcus mutans]